MKKDLTISKMFVLTLIFGLTITNVNAQHNTYVGLRLPRLTTEQRESIGVELHPENGRGNMIFNEDSARVQYWDGNQWVQLESKESIPIWFYMPSIVIDVSRNVADTTINLYDEYYRQFHVSAPQSQIVGSREAPDINIATNVYARNELYYYVIGYDNSVFLIHEITQTGEMRFDINATNVSEETFMNIIFVVK